MATRDDHGELEQPESGEEADVANGERPVKDTTEAHPTGERQAQENRRNDPPA